MSRATPQLRKFAEQLIAHEAKVRKSSTSHSGRAFTVVEKLRPHLTNLMGMAGFRALLARSLTLAAAEVVWLRVVQLNADGTWEGLDELEAQVSPADFLEARVVALAQLIGLLVAFIGKNLTLRLVGEIWPSLSLNELDFS